MEPRAETVIVVSGGGRPPVPLQLPQHGTVVAADEGVEHAHALGLHVDVAVGDFDSASPDAVDAAHAAGARIERHPAEKDATDLELALAAALAFAPRRILVLGGDAGRLDHLIAGVLLLGAESLAAVEVDAVLGDVRLHVVRGERTLTGAEGELVSLLPLGGAAEGVTTDGLRYPLSDEALAPGSSRGVSNVFAAPRARIVVRRGVLLAVRPGDEGKESV